MYEAMENKRDATSVKINTIKCSINCYNNIIS